MAKEKEEITPGILETFAEHLQWNTEELESTQEAIRKAFDDPNYIPYDQRGTEEKWIK